VEHAWCHDIARDAAVRAAEDGRTGPLPTLGEAIAGPFAEAAERSSTVSETGEGQSGLRTERVVLEITHDGKHGPVSTWPFECGSHGKGVRVVEEDELEVTVGDNEPWQKAILNDAVSIIVDGGDWGRGNSMDHGKLGAAVIWADKEIGRLRARVAVMEEARKRFDTALEEARDASGINDFIVQRDEAFAERDAAIREREKLRGEITSVRNCWGVSRDANDVLKARVAELEAASGGGEGEPVANFTFHADDSAERARYVGMTVKPLQRPQPRGWLSDEERKNLTGVFGLLRDLAKVCGRDAADRCELSAVAIESILARSSPPEVVRE